MTARVDRSVSWWWGGSVRAGARRRSRGGGRCGGLGRCGGRDRPAGLPQAGGVAEPDAGVGAPRDEGTAFHAWRADHFDAVRVQDVSPVQAGRRPLRVDQRRPGRPGRVALAGLVASAGEVLAQGVRCPVKEVGAEAGPAFRRVVDEVRGQVLGVAGEPVLVRGEQQRQLMAGVAVPVDVRPGVAGGGGAGDDRRSGQRIFLSTGPVSGRGGVRARPVAGVSPRGRSWAVPVLTGSAAYAVSEAFGWKYGLDEKPYRAKQFYAVIVAATLVGMLINFLGINPITALFWTAVLNGFLAPPLLIVIMLIANNQKIMGKRVNGRWLNILGWLTAAIMTVAAIALIITFKTS